MLNVEQLKDDLNKLGNMEKARMFSRYFKTGPGQYGEGDVFLGVNVPELREVAKNYTELGLEELEVLLESKVHEHRFISLIILIGKYKGGDDEDKKKIFNFYLRNYKNINNWDLVDLSAPAIVGDYLSDKVEEKQVIYDFALSDNLWKKRISIISTLEFIRNKNFEDTLKIAEILLNDEHDLIHKASGWMLREVGKRGGKKEENAFLQKFYNKMPRTMLRYAIERFPEEERRKYLGKKEERIEHDF